MSIRSDWQAFLQRRRIRVAWKRMQRTLIEWEQEMDAIVEAQQERRW